LPVSGRGGWRSWTGAVAPWEGAAGGGDSPSWGRILAVLPLPCRGRPPPAAGAVVAILVEVAVPTPEAGGVLDAVGVPVLLVLLLVIHPGGGGCLLAYAPAGTGRGQGWKFELHCQGHAALHALVEAIRELDADVRVAAGQDNGVICLGVELLEAYHAVEGERGGRHDGYGSMLPRYGGVPTNRVGVGGGALAY
jgi:hypothetical protein